MRFLDGVCAVVAFALAAFNSLYEIPGAGVNRQREGDVRIFQFSLWDSHRLHKKHTVHVFNLSILFMRFWNSDWEATRRIAWLSILFMRFLLRSEDDRCSTADFQFSLWDSAVDTAGNVREFKTFNSLYEILHLRLTHPLLISSFQFSLWDSDFL